MSRTSRKRQRQLNREKRKAEAAKLAAKRAAKIPDKICIPIPEIPSCGEMFSIPPIGDEMAIESKTAAPASTAPHEHAAISKEETAAIENDIALDLCIPLVHDEVAELATVKWKESGEPAGVDSDIWTDAENILMRKKEKEAIRKAAEKYKKSVNQIETIRAAAKARALKDKGKVTCWDLTEATIGNCDRVLLWGVSGTGKSWAARRANLNGHKVFSVSLTDDTPAAELRGHYGIIDGSYKWLDGPCVMAWRQGGRLVLNELEKASGDAQTFLLGTLDDPEIAQQTLPNGETIYPASGFHVVATMNGHPDHDLNPALRDRFPVCININEVAPPALEKLPPDIRHIAKNSGIIENTQRRISIRVWNEFIKLRRKVGDSVAANCVFGERANMVLDHLRITNK